MALLVGAPPPVASKDRHVRALLANTYHHFHQWKAPANENARAALTRLRDTLDRLLPVVRTTRAHVIQCTIVAGGTMRICA